MQLKTRLIIKCIFAFSFVVLTASCSSLTTAKNQSPKNNPIESVFRDSYESIWQATQLAMAKYPMKLSDIDSGTYETQTIRNEYGWISPGSRAVGAGGRMYQISIKILRGRASGLNQATKVSVLKTPVIQRDFFSDSEVLSSDSLEEQSIIYRIERELQIAKALKKVTRD